MKTRFFLLVVVVLLPFFDGKRQQKRHTEEISFAARDGLVIDNKGRTNRKSAIREDFNTLSGSNSQNLSPKHEISANVGLESTPQGSVPDSLLSSEARGEVGEDSNDSKTKSKESKSARGKLAKTEGAVPY